MTLDDLYCTLFGEPAGSSLEVQRSGNLVEQRIVEKLREMHHDSSDAWRETMTTRDFHDAGGTLLDDGRVVEMVKFHERKPDLNILTLNEWDNYRFRPDGTIVGSCDCYIAFKLSLGRLRPKYYKLSYNYSATEDPEGFFQYDEAMFKMCRKVVTTSYI